MKLTEFLLARIAEDEAVYDRAAEAEAESCRRDGIPDMTAQDVKDYWATVETKWPRHLAECEAKRQIVERLSAAWAVARTVDDTDLSDVVAVTEWTLKTLAVPHAEHPDYREEWRP